MPVLKREEVAAVNMNTHDVHTILGPESTFEGKLAFDGAVRIDGHFKGEVQTSDRLIVGEGAKVQANIHVGSIVITGEVRGDVTATVSVEIHKPGKLIGNINTPQLMIEAGVIFEGSCIMTKKGTGQGDNKVKLLKENEKPAS